MKTWVKYTLTSAVWLAVTFLSGMILYLSDRGLDLTDESMYLMDLFLPEASSPMRKGNVILSFLMSPFDPGILTYRWLRLGLTLLASSILGVALARFIRSELNLEFDRTAMSLIVGITVLGALASYGIFPRTISYNSIGLIIGLAALATLLKATIRSSRLSYLFIGVLVMLQVFNKFPSGIAISLFIGGFIIITKPIRESWKFLVFYAGGILATIALYAMFIDSLLTWVNEVQQFMSLDQSHSIKETLVHYLHTLERRSSSALENGWFLIIPSIIAIAALFLLRRRSFRGKLLLAYVPAILIAGWMWIREAYMQGILFYPTSAEFFIFLIALSAAISLYTLYAEQTRKWGTWMLILWCLPPLLSLGTNADLYVHMQQYIVFHVLILLLFVFVTPDRTMTAAISAVLAITMVVLVSRTFVGHTLFPYRTTGPLTELKEPVQVWQGGPIMVDSRVAHVKRELSFALRTNDLDLYRTALISLNKLPGLHLLTSLPSVGSSWHSERSRSVSGAYLSNIPDSVDQLLITIDHGDSMPLIIEKSLTQSGFQSDFDPPMVEIPHPTEAKEMDILRYRRRR